VNVEDVLTLLRLVHPPLSGQIRSSNVVMHCPFALVSGHRNGQDRTPSLGLLPREDDECGGVWNCFSCGRRGNIRYFFRLLEKELTYDVSEAVQLLDQLLAQDLESIVQSLPSYESHVSSHASAESYRIFPESWLAPYRGRVARALLERGISLETIQAWEVGFDRQHQRIIYPVRNRNGVLVGAVGGLVRQPREFEVKYKNYWHRLCYRCQFPVDHRDGQYVCSSCSVPVERESALEGFRKAKHLFGAQWFGGNVGIGTVLKPVAVIVEGVVDALAVWQAVRGWQDPYGCALAPLALLGSDPSRPQADGIVEMTSDRRMVVFLDNDDAGEKGHRALYGLLGSRLRYFRVGYDKEEAPGGDPASLQDKTPRPVEQIRRMLAEAKVIMRG
jgi:hypothetical protein